MKLLIQIAFRCTSIMVSSKSLLTCFAGAQQLGMPLVQQTPLLRSSLQRVAEDILPEVDRRGLALPTVTGLRPLVIRPPLSQASDLSSNLPSSFAFSSQSSNSSRYSIASKHPLFSLDTAGLARSSHKISGLTLCLQHCSELT